MIFGANGFIGGAIKKAASQNPNILTVVEINSDFFYDNQASLKTFLDSLPVIHVVIIAAEPDPRKVRDKSDYVSMHLDVTGKVLSVLRRLPHSPSVFYLGSLWAFSNNASPLCEEELWGGPLEPNLQWYSYPKRLMSLQLNLLSSKGLIQGCTLILGNVFGPGDRSNRLVCQLLEQMRSGLQVINLSGEGTELRDFIFVDDQVDRIIQCCLELQSPLPQTLNIGGGSPQSVQTIASVLSDLQNYQGTIEFSGDQGSAISPTSSRFMDMTRANKLFHWDDEDLKDKIFLGLKKLTEEKVVE